MWVMLGGAQRGAMGDFAVDGGCFGTRGEDGGRENWISQAIRHPAAAIGRGLGVRFECRG